MSILSAKNLTYRYTSDVLALDNVSLEVNEGEFVAVIGHNGSGKSTLARLFNGLLQPTAGDVIVDGINTKETGKLFDVRKTVGVVFQNPDNQLVASIVEDDIAFGAENLGLEREEIGKRIDFALDTVGMQQFRHSTPTKLSGGQKQRIAIAGVLAIMPKVLILDESTAMLDPVGRREVMSVVNKLNKEKGMTIIDITHYMEEIVYADKVIVLDNGKIALCGTPKEIFAHGEELQRYGLTIPLATKIAHTLRNKGVNIDESVLDAKALGDELCKLLPKA